MDEKRTLLKSDRGPAGVHTLAEDFPSNSNKSKREVIEEHEEEYEELTNTAIVRKKPLLRRFKEVFLGAEVHKLPGSILEDVLIPQAKNTVADAISNIFDGLNAAVDVFLFGEDTKGRTRKKDGKYVDYGGAFKERRKPTNRNRTRHDFSDISYPHRAEAVEILSRLNNYLREGYDWVSVADFYEVADVQSTEITDSDYGWASLKGATIKSNRYGEYYIDFPPTKYLR